MTETSTTAADTRARRRPFPIVCLLAISLGAVGVALSSWSPWMLLLAGAGAFGPGLLREIGWLADRDEFQQQAAHRAGYHAFLAAGFAGFVVLAFLRSGGRPAADAADVPALLLAVLWFTWLLSSLVTYWGPQVAAARFLRVFGSLWLVFAVVSNIGPEWTGWAALLLHPLLAVPFFALAWAAPRWPRVSGAILLVAAAGAFWFLGLFRNPNLGLLTQGFTLILFVGPLLAGGVALLTHPRE
ncbi:MAG: hypothetical protein K8T90_12330 [Planctomycetes bacterium]|nr:hypothetical protein [Planctomycetota bacterium]